MSARRLFVALVAALACAGPAAAQAPAMPSGEGSPIADASAHALWWGDFDELEKQYLALRASTEYVDGGTLKLQWFRVGLARVFNLRDARDPYYAQLEALTHAWSVEHPRSALAQLLYARALYARAMEFRGSEYVRDTPEQSMRMFLQYLGRAQQQLVAHADVLREESTANVYMVMFGRWNGWPFERLHAIAVDSLRKNPADNGAWTELAMAALPRWGGSVARFDDVVREAGRSVAGLGPGATYAFIYNDNSSLFDGNMFQSSRVDWPTMRQGFRDYVAQYPNAYVLNRFAYQACLAHDKETTLQVLEEIGPQPLQRAWDKRYEACRTWARQQ